MDEIFDAWFEDDDGTYTDENGIPFWVVDQQEEELRAWEIERMEQEKSI